MPDDVEMRLRKRLAVALSDLLDDACSPDGPAVDTVMEVIAETALAQPPAPDGRDGLEEDRSQALMTMEYAISLIVALKPEKARIYLEQQAAAIRALKKGDRE